jgi:hypothetical protein
MDSRMVDKLLLDSEAHPWRLDRDSLNRYIIFAHEHGFEPFRVEAGAIWSPFARSEVSVFRGPCRSDIRVEDHLAKFLRRLDCKIESASISGDVEKDLRERNCVIIGSPKANPASEIALALLWQAEPFNANKDNRSKIPISFLGMSMEHGSALLVESTRHGILLPGSTGNCYLKVDWLPPEKFGPYVGLGRDAAILVVCHRPLGTERDVTSIVIAGYTGLATLVAAQELTRKTLPDIKPEENPGTPCLAALKFAYKKRRQYRRSLDNLRSFKEGSAQWAPPWNDF